MKPLGNQGLLDTWDAWVGTLRVSDETKSYHYQAVRRMVAKVKPEATGYSLGHTRYPLPPLRT